MKYIRYEKTDNIGRMWIDRPEALNAMNREVVDEMDKCLDEVLKDKELKVFILGGESNFAAGADIKEMVDLNEEEARNFGFSPAFNKIMFLEIPTIAAIDGFALGGGTELSLCCDMRIATEDAVLGQPEMKLGITPGGGGLIRLPATIGYAKAFELIMTGRNIKAKEALEIGLVNMLVKKEELLDETYKLAKKIASMPSDAVKCAKRVMKAGMIMDSVEEGTLLERDEWAKLFAGTNQKEGMRAFIEKRKPEFT